MAKSVRKFAHGDYTVGWICALPETEFVAAGAMLDEEHPVLPAVHSQDTNSYLLGRIGDHNVVIACLPAETTGRVSAATVAKDMLRSFPAVRFGLMVGIGGGAPYYGTQGYDNTEFSGQEEEDSEDDLEDIRDIRLGDVVVSLHSKSAEAVVQYDFGKSLQEKEFVHTGGKLNKPPAIVLSAVSVLQQQHRRKGHTIPGLLADTLSKNPGMAEEFRYPGLAKDRLFKADIVHLEGRKSCKACCGPNNVNLVRRTDRHGTAPKIHYGTIGSADQVMTDAILRDKWAQKEKIICFEMEAAGLMDPFPCLVIRGICDYADSHKNKIWQPYAAATAASYAKELLLVIPGQGVMDLCPIEQSLGEIKANVDTMRSKLARKEDYDLLNWITTVDYGPLQSDHFQKRQAGTGEWLLNSAQFQAWLKTEQKTLFCPGIPGAGKTTLTSIVIDHLTRRASEDRSLGVAYVYCDFQQKNEQRVDKLLSSLLKQLSQRQPTLPGEVKGLYNQHKTERTRPSLEEIARTLHYVAVKYQRVFILVDALDECRESENCRIKFVSELYSLQARCGINIFATSRMNGEIEKLFTNAISLEIRATDHDVEIYLDERMRFEPSDVLDDNTKKEIKRTVVDATGGMFLLAKLHIESLMTLPTRGHIKDAVRNLAKGEEALDKTYSQTMERIDDHPKERRDLAKQILGWVFYARRPLSILELRYALAVKTQSAKLDKDYVPSTKLVRSLCLGLVTIDKGSAMVRLVHYTTQEYFRRTQSRWFPNAELEIVQTCITYLSFDRFKNGFCLNDAELSARIRLNLLYHYSARNWGHHAREASIRAERLILSLLNGAGKLSSKDGLTNRTSAHIAAYLVQRNRVLEFLNSESNISGSIQAMLVNEGYDNLFPNHSQDVPRQMTSMHLAAYFGLSDIVGILISDGHDPNTGDSYKRTPLSWAAENGHKEVVCLLLETAGLDPDAKAKSGRTPLLWAACEGHAAVVTLLLEKHSVDPDSKDSDTGQTPLSLAAWRGHGMVVWLLLRNDRVEPDSRSGSGQTPLSYAAEEGHETVVLLLLANDRVDPDSRSNVGRTPLSYAAEGGHEAVVRILLKNSRVDLNSKDSVYGQTPLWRAVRKGHEGVVRLLLAQDKVTISDADLIYKRTLLSWAAVKGHEAIVNLLLERNDVDIDSMDRDERTPLSYASENGFEAIVKLLLIRGAAVDALDKKHYTPLFWAAWNGYEAIMEILLDRGATVDAVDKDHYTPLSRAARQGQEAVVKTLLKRGAAVDPKYGRTPLSVAAENGHEAVVKILLERGAAVDPKYGQTPLSMAAENGHEAVVKTLLEGGAAVDSRDTFGRTPLSVAAKKGHEAVAKILLEGGAAVDSRDTNYQRPPLSWAAQNGHEAVVKLLLNRGAAVDLMDTYIRTPLSWAAGNGHEAVVKLLLNRGAAVDSVGPVYGQTPLSWAAQNGHEVVVKILLDGGAEAAEI